MNIRIFSYTILALLCLNSCQKQKPNISLKIIQTTDVHGCIFPYDFIKGEATNNSLANISGYVNQLRSTNPNGVILLDNGDYLQGQPTVYYYNFEDTSSSHLAADVFNYMQYDAATVGNHDIETGHAVYDRFREQINLPYLAANAINTITNQPYFEPYSIVERQGLKVAILGLITPGIPNWLPENIYQGIEFTDMIESAKFWMSEIETKHHPDLMVGMFHSGVDHTYDNQSAEMPMNENASQLVAEQVPGFDIVLAGHDHKFFNKKIINTIGDTVILLDPRSHARAISEITVDFAYNKQQEKYTKQIKATIIDMEQAAPDSLFLAKFDKQFKATKTFVSRPIGILEETLHAEDAYFGCNHFMNLIHEVQLDNSAAEISFSSPLSYNTTVHKGELYVSDLFKLYKYENMLYTLSLSGKEIDQYLEYSYAQWFNQMTNMHDHMLKIEANSEGKYELTNRYYNLSSAYGIEYIVSLTKPDGDKVRILGMSSGKPFYNDSTYLVAVNSYRGTGGGGHFTEGVGLSKQELKSRLVHASDKDLRFYLMKWIENKEHVRPEKRANWKIIPEDYYEKAKVKDYNLLFNQK